MVKCNCFAESLKFISQIQSIIDEIKYKPDINPKDQEDFNWELERLTYILRGIAEEDCDFDETAYNSIHQTLTEAWEISKKIDHKPKNREDIIINRGKIAGVKSKLEKAKSKYINSADACIIK